MSSKIRLVTILPGGWLDDIECTVAQTLSESQSSYKALSYVWGAPGVRKDSIQNGRPFRVAVNLESTPRHLRLKKPQTMWIDAIYIMLILSCL
jgi:hypothetical protein